MKEQILTSYGGHNLKLPEGWTEMTLSDISDEIYRYPTYYNIEYVNNGIPEIRGELIQIDGTLESDRSKYRHSPAMQPSTDICT
jgi:hypothetical protein